jgi:hypothetical protein
MVIYNILQPFGMFYGQFMLWSFDIFFPIWVHCVKKNLATLVHALVLVTALVLVRVLLARLDQLLLQILEGLLQRLVLLKVDFCDYDELRCSQLQLASGS